MKENTLNDIRNVTSVDYIVNMDVQIDGWITPYKNFKKKKNWKFSGSSHERKIEYSPYSTKREQGKIQYFHKYS